MDQNSVIACSLYKKLCTILLENKPPQGSALVKQAYQSLCQGIAQAALTPENEDSWHDMTLGEFREAIERELKELKEYFNSTSPFQFPVLKQRYEAVLKTKAKLKSQLHHCSMFLPHVKGHTSPVMTYKSCIRDLDADEQADLLVTLVCGYSLGSKKFQGAGNGYAGISIKPGHVTRTAPPGRNLGNVLGGLRSHIATDNFLETLFYNLWTLEDIEESSKYPSGLGTPLWKQMPTNEDDEIAREYRGSFLSTLVPLDRFCFFEGQNLYCIEGLQYPRISDGGFTPHMTAAENKDGWYIKRGNPNREPYRELVSQLAFMGDPNNKVYICEQVKLVTPRVLSRPPESRKFTVKSMGLSSNQTSGEQKISGYTGITESEFTFEVDKIKGDPKSWYANFSTQIRSLEGIFWKLQMGVERFFLDVMHYNEISHEQQRTKTLRSQKKNGVLRAWDFYDVPKTAKKNLEGFMNAKMREIAQFWMKVKSDAALLANSPDDEELCKKLQSKARRLANDIFYQITSPSSEEQWCYFGKNIPFIYLTRKPKDKMKDSKNENFVKHILKVIDKGDGFKLKRAFSPQNIEYELEAMPFIRPFFKQWKVDHNDKYLPSKSQMMAYRVVAQCMALNKAKKNTDVSFIKAYQLAYGITKNDGKALDGPCWSHIKRIIACRDIEDIAPQIQTSLRLIAYKYGKDIDYASLLSDILLLRWDDGKDQLSQKWATEFWDNLEYKENKGAKNDK